MKKLGLIKKFTSNKTKHVETEKELINLIKKLSGLAKCLSVCLGTKWS